MNLHIHETVIKATKRLLEIREKERCEESLLDFAKYVWPVVEPATPFKVGWVLEAITAHLEAVTYGHIRRLLINVPPGFTKSLMTDVFWPAWEWGPKNMPHMRYVCAAYAQSLTVRDNLRCRNVVVNDRYQRNWGNRFQLSDAQGSKIKFENTGTGWKLATSVEGVGTGERGDRIIVDDPNNVKDTESEAVREGTKLWFTEVLPDRLNNQQESAIIIIQQRVHEEDVSGIAISRDMGYTHLCIPMEYVPRVYINGYIGDEIKTLIDDDTASLTEDDIFWYDPRNEDGELAWPERFPDHSVEELKRDKTAYAWASQYQQSPEPRGGAIIKRDYWQVYKEDKYPQFEFIVASLDTAYTENTENDPSAMTIWGLFREAQPQALSRRGQIITLPRVELSPRLMLMHAWRGYLSFHELVEKVMNLCVHNKEKSKETLCFPIDRLLIENKAAGISVAQELERLLGLQSQFGIDLIDPRKYGDKVARVHGIEHIFSSGMVYAPDKKYADMVIDECAIFPRGATDDLVDTTSQALRWFRDRGFIVKREEEEMELEGLLAYKPKLPALYPV